MAVSEASFEFRDLDLELPAPRATFRLLLEAAGFAPAEQHLLFRVCDSGELEGVRLDDEAVLRGDGTDRFVAFRSDQSFQVEINGRRLEWGQSALSGLCAKRLVGETSPTTGVWLIWVDGAEERFIQPTETVELEYVKVRLRTGPANVLEIEGEQFQWPDPSITAEQIADLGGWEPAVGVLEVDPVTQKTRTLKPGEVVDLDKCKTYGKRIGWRRG